MLNGTSHFWKYKEFKTKNSRIKQKGNSYWTRSTFFPDPIDANTFRKYLRNLLGVNYTEHIEVSGMIPHITEIKSAIKNYNVSLEPKKIKRKRKFRIVKFGFDSLPHLIKENFGGSSLSPRR